MIRAEGCDEQGRARRIRTRTSRAASSLDTSDLTRVRQEPAVQETVVHPDRAALKATEFDTENHPTLQVIENTGQNCVAGCPGRNSQLAADGRLMAVPTALANLRGFPRVEFLALPRGTSGRVRNVHADFGQL